MFRRYSLALAVVALALALGVAPVFAFEGIPTDTLTLPAYNIADVITQGNAWVVWASGFLFLLAVLRLAPKFVSAVRRVLGASTR